MGKRWAAKDFLQDKELDPVDLQKDINNIYKKSNKVFPPEVMALLNKSKPRKSKHNNRRVMHDGVPWDSIAERDYYIYLKQKKQMKLIKKLDIKPMYKLKINGVLICKFFPDFGITYPDGTYVLHDVKGSGVTPVYSIKKKMLLAMQPELSIKEVYRKKGGWNIV